MHSIRTKITTMTVCAVVAVMIITTLISALAIRNLGTNTSNQILYLLCEDGEKRLDSYFSSVEQSVETISSYAESDLETTSIDDLNSHIKRVEEIFEKTANHTNTILTYYYRIDPAVSETAKGFWYVDLDGNGFKKHEVTDITLYDTEDQTNLVWFTVPKATGESVWLPPYFTDNLDVYVLSYNVPVHKNGRFIGVIGIEIDYNTMAKTIDDITLYENGYAFINDDKGDIIYHPYIPMENLIGEKKPKVPDGLLGEDNHIKYTYEGVEKQAVWLRLNNGMRINVTVPISEINVNWRNLIKEIICVSILLILLFIFLAMHLAKHITNPLTKLTEAALQVDKGNYDIKLYYSGNDEVGILTKTFGQLISHMKSYIKDLNDLAYSDPLTSVHNKGAFDIYVRDIQAKIDEGDKKIEFAVGFFDCNYLKLINDEYGHKKGDIYLKSTVSVICNVFSHSPVFRTGGDEFAMILQKGDYQNRESLIDLFKEEVEKTHTETNKPWEQVSVAMGIAVYDPDEDRSVINVIHRADKLMYEDKRDQKEKK